MKPPAPRFRPATGRSLLLLALAVPALSPALSATLPPAGEAPALMLAERWRDEFDPAAYWVSEKLDGVRAHWDGSRLRFRSGLTIPAPAWFLAGLPARALDDELWLGRGRFDELSAIVRRDRPEDRAWRALRYRVFDLPADPGTFSERLVRLRSVVAAARIPWLQVEPQFRVRDRVALAAHLQAVLAQGGEGLMLHRADARWSPGRKDVLLKLTPWQDAEARVIAHVPGRGRLQGMVGALEVETADGRRFRIGSGLTDRERSSPPRIGAEVSYRYRELTPAGLPRFPAFVRERVLP